MTTSIYIPFLLVLMFLLAGYNYEQYSCIFKSVSGPGSVINITALPESDVKKPRSITVFWHTPRLRDLNGKLTNYFVTYQLMNSVSY